MRILSYDIESTTGNHKDGSMCTFGYCIADEQFNILTQKDIVMKPKTRRFETKIKLHYEREFIKKSQPFPVYYNEIKNLFLGGGIIIGFSVMNDVEFLNNACTIYNLPIIEYEFLDVQLLYKTVYKKATLSGLSVIASELNIDYLAHRSDEDAKMTLLVLKHICNDKKLTLEEVIRKYHITFGYNKKGEVSPCTNGVYTKREINYLILDFVEKNAKHSRRYKGGLSQKTFAFSDEIRYENVDKFRQIMKRIYDLNGRISSIESSNVFVSNVLPLPKKYNDKIEERNKNKRRITVISEEELLKTLKELPNLDFSNDVELLRKHRLEVKKQRELNRKLKLENLKKQAEQSKNENND